MCGSTKVKSESTTTPTPTAEETELNRLELERQRAAQPGMIGTQQQALNLSQLLLQGQGLPGYLAGLPGGMPEAQQITSEEATLGEDYTANIVQQSLRDLYPQFQAMGLPIESGVAQSIAGRTTGDIRRQVAETNIERQLMAKQFNIETERARQGFNLGQLLNLLNLAVGGQAQIQQPILAGGESLGQRLAGLRTVTTTGAQTQRQPWYSALQPAGQLAGGVGGFMTGWKTK